MKIVCEELSTARSAIVSTIRKLNGIPFGIIGGPPCQNFSIMENRKGFADERGQLIEEYAKLIVATKPTFFVIENVPTVLSDKQGHKAKFLEILSTLTSENYHISYENFCAADFGAATSRKRMICVGFRKMENFEFPEPTHQGVRQLKLGEKRLP